MNTLVGVKIGESEDSFIQNQEKKNRKSIHINQRGVFRTTTDPIELKTPFRMFKSFQPTFTPRSKKITGILLRAEKDITPSDLKMYLYRNQLPMKVDDPSEVAIKWKNDGFSIPDILEKKYCTGNFPKSNVIKKTDQKEMSIRIEELGDSWKSHVNYDCKSLKCIVHSVYFKIIFNSTALCYNFKMIVCEEKKVWLNLQLIYF